MSFSPITPDNISISSDSYVTTLWSTDGTILGASNILYDSQQPNENYLNVYAYPNSIVDNDPEFSISYGNINGTGSLPLNPLVPELTPTRINYGQIRTLINGDENTLINFGNGNNASDDVYIINISRSRYKEKLFLNTFNLTLYDNNGTTLKLTNNIKDSNTVSYCDAGRIYNIVSGSNGESIPGGGTTISGSYGSFLPDVGLILLNPRALSLPPVSGGLNLNIDATNNFNNNKILFDYIKSGNNFSLNSEETISSQYIFVYLKSGEYNYTTNPSIINENGEFYHETLINNPQTYITTVGLYNDSNELLAVAKLSKPLAKNFTKGGMLRVKLSY